MSSAAKDETKGLIMLPWLYVSIKVELGEVSDGVFLADSGTGNDQAKTKGKRRSNKKKKSRDKQQPDGVCSNDLLEMDPEALLTVQNAIEEARAGDATTLKQLLEMAEMLGNKGYNLGLSRAATEGSRVTALMVASSYGQIGAMRKLIAMGASVSAVDAQGFTPLVWACRAGKLDAARALLEEFQSPWVKPSPKASPEIQELLNSVPEARRRKGAAPARAQSKSRTQARNKGGKPAKRNGKGSKSSSTSKADGGKGRKLQAWTPSADEKSMQVDPLDTSKGRDRSYDPVGANEKLGVKFNGYDEGAYTTKQVKQAGRRLQRDKAAKEIETKNRKRNKKSAQAKTKMDEEDKYSAVKRKKGAGKAAGADSFTDAGVRGKKSGGATWERGRRSLLLK